MRGPRDVCTVRTYGTKILSFEPDVVLCLFAHLRFSGLGEFAVPISNYLSFAVAGSAQAAQAGSAQV